MYEGGIYTRENFSLVYCRLQIGIVVIFLATFHVMASAEENLHVDFLSLANLIIQIDSNLTAVGIEIENPDTKLIKIFQNWIDDHDVMVI